jgi:hypothetical protein
MVYITRFSAFRFSKSIVPGNVFTLGESVFPEESEELRRNR